MDSKLEEAVCSISSNTVAASSRLERAAAYVKEHWPELLFSSLGFGTDFITLATLAQQCEQNPTPYLVEDLVPADDVHIAIGDSGLGKTPWAYQLGLCVAAGKPFLGYAVRPAKVLYYDLENGQQEILKLGRDLCAYLGIPEFPPDFLVLPNDGAPPKIEVAAAAHNPGLIIVDTLRPYRPDAEAGNDTMGHLLQGLHSAARQEHCAILLLHHIRKSRESERLESRYLEDTAVNLWLERASGARAIVNQTNARIALAEPKNGNAALVMNSFVKLKGETGPVYLERVCNDAGEPIGYQRMTGASLLGNSDQETAFAALPPRFTFTEAKKIYGHAADPTNKFLRKCEAAGLLRRRPGGGYEKLET
jgi:hypothetical protein